MPEELLERIDDFASVPDQSHDHGHGHGHDD